jgi:hypothetical protein
MKRFILLVVMSLCLALPVATLFVPAVHADSTTVIKDTETNNTVDRTTTTNTDLATPTDNNTNRILLWGGVILVAALIIGLAMHNRSDSTTHTDVHVD